MLPEISHIHRFNCCCRFLIFSHHIISAVNILAVIKFVGNIGFTHGDEFYLPQINLILKYLVLV